MSTSDRYPGAAYIPSMGNAADMEDDRYIVMTKIMVLAMAVLFAAVFFVICLHIYTKWIWSSSSTGPPAAASTRASFWFWPRGRRRSDRTEVTDMLDINMVVGLGKEAVEALPTFQYRKENSKEEEVASMECAICLGQFQEDELGRSLPKCGHCFHLECIDMWLFSHSTCPLCRAVLQEAELEPDVDLAAEPDQASSIQVFTQNSSTQQTEQQSEQEPKRADSIPANVLFWGNVMQQQVGADSRQHRNNSSNSSQQQIAIDIDNMGTTPRARTPRHGSNSSSS